MADKKTSRFCVVDHANKRGERERLNPNRASIQAARERGILPADLSKRRRPPVDTPDEDNN